MSWTITDDIPDFIAEQEALRRGAGAQVTFLVPNDPVWPGGTEINVDTGLPFDPTVVATNATPTEIVVTCLVIEKQGSALRPQSDTYFDQSGFRLGMDIILDIGAADYDSTASRATGFSVNGKDFAIEESKPFSIGSTIYRWLVYGSAK